MSADQRKIPAPVGKSWARHHPQAMDTASVAITSLAAHSPERITSSTQPHTRPSNPCHVSGMRRQLQTRRRRVAIRADRPRHPSSRRSAMVPAGCSRQLTAVALLPGDRPVQNATSRYRRQRGDDQSQAPSDQVSADGRRFKSCREHGMTSADTMPCKVRASIGEAPTEQHR